MNASVLSLLDSNINAKCQSHRKIVNKFWLKKKKTKCRQRGFLLKGYVLVCCTVRQKTLDSKYRSNINAKCKSHRKMVPGSRQDKSSSNPSQKREICLTKKNSLQRENHKIEHTSQIYFKYKSQINFTSAELPNLFSTRSKKSGAVQGDQWLRFS